MRFVEVFICDINTIQASSVALRQWIFKWICDWHDIHKNESNPAVFSPPLIFPLNFLLPVTFNCLVFALSLHFPAFVKAGCTAEKSGHVNAQEIN